MWGFFSLALKPLHNYASLDILFYRIFFSVIVMLAINLVFRKKRIIQDWGHFMGLNLKQRKSITLLTVGGAVILASNWFIFIYVVNHINVKAASLAYLICPILTTVFAYFILREKLSIWQWVAVAISVLGCMLIAVNHLKDIFYSLVVASTYAIYLVSQRKNSGMDKFLILNIQLLIIAIVILPFYPNYSGAVPTESLFYVCLFFIVVFFTIVPLFLNLFALKGLDSATVGIIMYINPIINFLLAIFYFKEAVTPVQLVSYFLILVSIVVFNKKVIFDRKKNTDLQLEENV